MPPYVPPRRSKALGNGYDLHSFGEFEKRQILGEHKEKELVAACALLKSAQKSEQILGYACLATLDHRGGNPDSHDCSRRKSSSRESRITFLTASCAPTNRRTAPSRRAHFLARTITPTPLLSTKRTS